MANKISRAAVKEGRRLKASEESAQWEWGDLLVKSCPDGTEPADVTEAVQAFVAEVFPELDDIGQKTKCGWMRLCRLTSLAWPVEDRHPEVSHKVHEIFKRAPNRAKLIRKQAWTITAAYREVDIATTARTTRSAPSAERAKLATRLLDDPAVAQLLMSDSAIRVQLMKAACSVDTDRHSRVKKEIEEFSPAAARASGFTRASRTLYQAQHNLEKVLELVMATENLTEAMRAALLRQAQKTQLVGDFLVSHLESGDRSFEEAMKSILEEEAR